MLNKNIFNLDFSYKYLKNNSSNEQKTKKTTANIIFWKTNNRLSSFRSLMFLEKFFSGVTIKHIVVRTRTAKTRQYLNYKFKLHSNSTIFEFLGYKLPEPDIRFNGTKYILTYNFYRFHLDFNIDLLDHYHLQKFLQVIPKKWQDS